MRRGDVEALHQARVASRRIREALPIIAAQADRATLKKLGRRVRDITRLLGPVRELDVRIALLLEVERSTPSHRAAIDLVRSRLVAERQAQRERMLGRANAMDLKRLTRKLVQIGVASCSDYGRRAQAAAAWRNVLVARTVRRSKRLREAIDRAGSLYMPDPLHAVRIAAKKLRYVLEVAEEAGIPRVGALIRPLKDVQGTLGRLHDLQVLLDCQREVEASGGTDAERAGLAAFTQALEEECRRLHAEFLVRREDLLRVCSCARRELAEQIAVGRSAAERAIPARRRPRVAMRGAAVLDVGAGARARQAVRSGGSHG
jgi:CHAD domain-containing protein